MVCCTLKKLIGSPDDASLGFLRSDNARRYVRQLPQYPKQQFSSRFRNTTAGALDLLEKMLVFDPSKRITGTISFNQNTGYHFSKHRMNIQHCHLFCHDMQLLTLCATHTWPLFMISTRSPPALVLSLLTSSCHPLLKRILKNSSGGNP